MDHKGFKFFLTHEPDKVPTNWDGWAICGHTHNKYPDTNPFINKSKKRINVSVEFTQYKPVDMKDIIKNIEES